MKGIVGILCALNVYLIVAEVCPGGQQTCAAGMTCCQLPSGQEGCCPYENATCCLDKVHCCPHGYDCLTSSCRKQVDNTVKEIRRLLVDDNRRNTNSSVNSIICPDYSQCSDGDTCCPVGGGHYGCCPMTAAVCCNDLKTCCPNGYTCIGQGGCEREDKIVKRLQMSPKGIVCPGGKYKCPNYNTCCSTEGGHYACCPQYHAVCCRGGRHCCPSGYICDSSTEQCNKN